MFFQTPDNFISTNNNCLIAANLNLLKFKLMTEHSPIANKSFHYMTHSVNVAYRRPIKYLQRKKHVVTSSFGANYFLAHNAFTTNISGCFLKSDFYPNLRLRSVFILFVVYEIKFKIGNFSQTVHFKDLKFCSYSICNKFISI